MKNYDSHVYLYAKLWYKKSDVISDLKVIYGLRNGIDAEYMHVNDVVSCLTALTWKHLNKQNDRMFLEFISDISPNSFRRTMFPNRQDTYDFNKAVIEKCLSILSLTEIKDIPEGLDDADPSILPLRSF